MNFLSLKFFILFLSFFYIYWSIPGSVPKARRWLLILASCIFYSFFSFPFLIHFLSVIIVNYLIYYIFFEKSYYTKLAVIFNLLNLFFFKYFYFFLKLIGQTTGIEILENSENINKELASIFGWEGFTVVLPATISYYTFQLISFAVD
ncbi:MAG: hypothetical protein KDK36_07120, partial [Leptospiraceae bacterium]|nr:hypothetical protein [Leptospiraceae bacterium]